VLLRVEENLTAVVFSFLFFVGKRQGKCVHVAAVFGLGHFRPSSPRVRKAKENQTLWKHSSSEKEKKKTTQTNTHTLSLSLLCLSLPLTRLPWESNAAMSPTHTLLTRTLAIIFAIVPLCRRERDLKFRMGSALSLALMLNHPIHSFHQMAVVWLFWLACQTDVWR
jgi:hypothetical protein